MKTREMFYKTAVILWFITAVYLVYKFSLQAGYWKNPLYANLFFYGMILIANKGFNKLTLYMILFYIGMGVWFIFSLMLYMGKILGG
ncbi:hypothetical protein [Planococcus halotolerans]|uniref:Uncharacterized protein n=1 Tax=Planococcus halotolerans TaxID=2233542 RepID=A0A365KKI6_9BACL|nr:hypothetical protein [Planococcus halotolerans]QHJ69619.1 hypothetical protein DNR44_002835 [Planococcus halotolerans]RAZ73642.1 hypothetical protein DP120_17050 [Planococcus halotolerans]